MDSGRKIRQRHQVLAVGADIHRIVVDRTLAALHTPLQRVRCHRSRKRQTIIDAGFDLSSLFVIVPRHQLKIGKRLSRVVHAVQLAERLQPRLPALLPHNAVHAPGGKRVIEPFITRSNRLLVWCRQARIVKAGQVTHSIIRARRDHPGITAIAKNVAEPAVILKNKCGLSAHGAGGGIPVNRIRLVDCKIRNHRLALYRHVSRRREIGVLYILQIAH
jgi:hypothetical protein